VTHHGATLLEEWFPQPEPETDRMSIGQS
jgi:hypothetical protein